MPRSGLAARAAALLEYPGAQDIDSAATTIERRQLIREKVFLRRIYEEWYAAIASAIPARPEPALELGSGAGFMADRVDNLITSDILELPAVDRVIDASGPLPFDDAALRAIAMINTLHHLPEAELFLAEASRCLTPGGVISIVEPWNTPWSRFVYGKLHHEPFDADARSWRFESSGPLSGANGALPWMIFVRDRARFEERFPELAIAAVAPIMPLRYLLSGGVSMRALVPASSFDALRALERASGRLGRSTAMFVHVVVVRR